MADVIESTHSDVDGWFDTIRDAYGGASDDFAKVEVHRLASALCDVGELIASEADLNAAIAVIDGVKPRTT